MRSVPGGDTQPNSTRGPHADRCVWRHPLMPHSAQIGSGVALVSTVTEAQYVRALRRNAAQLDATLTCRQQGPTPAQIGSDVATVSDACPGRVRRSRRTYAPELLNIFVCNPGRMCFVVFLHITSRMRCSSSWHASNGRVRSLIA